MTHRCYTDSPLGPVLITADERHILSVLVMDSREPIEESETEAIRQCKQQLQEYFDGQRKTFDLSLAQEGTPFQQKVWQQLTSIPFGQTITYMQLAKALGDPKSIRAAGTANGKNKLWIIVPCHRVVGADGRLVGYAGGLHRKKWLLDHEARMSGALTLGL
ncbi:MAG: methylated-DNA--[protein]-cysteine S-methyltransferase [Bacteroidetes bacterium]|nr:methylated-DNA--[protein]-cysteine S-methyltransferase [Bacteroidota bacterium]